MVFCDLALFMATRRPGCVTGAQLHGVCSVKTLQSSKLHRKGGFKSSDEVRKGRVEVRKNGRDRSDSSCLSTYPLRVRVLSVHPERPAPRTLLE